MLKRLLQWLIVGLLMSCSKGSGPTFESDNPNHYPYESGPAIVASASLQLGSIARNFSHQNNVACVTDKERNETVIIFNDANSGASLSVRMGRVDLSDSNDSRSYNVEANPGEDSFLISVNSDRNNGAYRLAYNPNAYFKPHCQINYTLDSWQLRASFRCYSMTNRAGQTQEASGDWNCKLQSEVDWQW
jgi:hypothetical protein